ncbi:MAG: mechanosensitive ion channel [Rikenellaceae bacterium]|nr:mechanosensitive ion channel [Rikenellaceae bacterium]
MITFLQSAATAATDSLSHNTFVDKIENLTNVPREELFSNLFMGLLSIAWKILAVILIYYIGRWLIRKINQIVGRIMVRRNVDPSLRSFLMSAISITLTIILIIMVIGILGFNTTSFIAIFASAGLAVGVALSGTLQNFAGGIMLLIFRPFRIGDYIESQGQGGTVKSLQFTSTVITTSDNKTIYLPNGPVFTSVLNNYTAEPTRRVEWTYSLAYGQDYEAVKKFFGDMIGQDKRILSNPTYNVNISAIAGGAITVIVWAWVNHENYSNVLYDMNQRVYENYQKYNLQLK